MMKTILIAGAVAVNMKAVNQQDAETESPEVQKFFGTLIGGLSLLWTIWGDEGVETDGLEESVALLKNLEKNPSAVAAVQADYQRSVDAAGSLAQQDAETESPEVQKFFGTLIGGLSLLWTIWGDEGVEPDGLEESVALLKNLEKNPTVAAAIQADYQRSVDGDASLAQTESSRFWHLW
jgi:hypothetical protein